MFPKGEFNVDLGRNGQYFIEEVPNSVYLTEFGTILKILRPGRPVGSGARIAWSSLLGRSRSGGSSKGRQPKGHMVVKG